MASDPHNPKDQEAHETASHYRHLAGIVWSLALTVIFAMATPELPVTRTAAIALGVLVVVWMFWKRVSSGLHQVKIILFYFALCILFMFVEIQKLLPVLPPREDPDPPVAEVSVGELPGIYTGFRTRENGRPSHVVFTIEEIRKEPSRMLCRYSLNEDLRLDQGEALLYTATAILELKDGTRLRYKRENGKITLWSIMGSKLELTRWIAP